MFSNENKFFAPKTSFDEFNSAFSQHFNEGGSIQEPQNKSWLKSNHSFPDHIHCSFPKKFH